MADIKYSYAYDGDVVVHIDDVSEHGTFYCISCGKEMVAKLGDKKSHHFAHKVNDVSCNSETYLHKLAKLLCSSSDLPWGEQKNKHTNRR